MNTTTQDATREVAAYLKGFALRHTHPNLSPAAQHHLLKQPNLWSLLASCDNLLPEAAEVLVREGDQGTLRSLASDQCNLTNEMLVLIAERGDQDVLYELAFRDDHPEEVDLILAKQSDETNLAVLAQREDLSQVVQGVIAERSQGPALKNLARQRHLPTEIYVMLSLRTSYQGHYQFLVFYEEPITAGRVGYQFLRSAYPETADRYAQVRGIDVIEWRALGENWTKSIAELVEAWRLTKR